MSVIEIKDLHAFEAANENGEDSCFNACHGMAYPVKHPPIERSTTDSMISERQTRDSASCVCEKKILPPFLDCATITLSSKLT